MKEWDEDGACENMVKTSGKLYRTSGGKYVVGVARYDEDNDSALEHFAVSGASIRAVAEFAGSSEGGNFDKDFLASLFAGTEAEDLFTETVE